MQAWLRHMGVCDFPGSYDNRRGGDSWGTQEYGRNWRPRACAEYNRRKQQYDEQRRIRDEQIKAASAIQFPSAAFDNLTDKVNGFFKKLIP
jgi:hypothetical protein